MAYVRKGISGVLLIVSVVLVLFGSAITLNVRNKEWKSVQSSIKSARREVNGWKEDDLDDIDEWLEDNDINIRVKSLQKDLLYFLDSIKDKSLSIHEAAKDSWILGRYLYKFEEADATRSLLRLLSFYYVDEEGLEEVISAVLISSVVLYLLLLLLLIFAVISAVSIWKGKNSGPLSYTIIQILVFLGILFISISLNLSVENEYAIESLFKLTAPLIVSLITAILSFVAWVALANVSAQPVSVASPAGKAAGASFCPFCGGQLESAGLTFCPQCGNKLSE